MERFDGNFGDASLLVFRSELASANSHYLAYHNRIFL